MKHLVSLALFLLTIGALYALFTFIQGNNSQYVEDRFASFSPEIENRFKVDAKALPPVKKDKIKPKKPVVKNQGAKVRAQVMSSSHERFTFLCKQFVEDYLSEQDILIDPNAKHYERTSTMMKMLKMVRKKYEALVQSSRDLKSSHVCAADEIEKYLTTIIESLSTRHRNISLVMKRRFIMSMFSIATLQYDQGNESFTLYLMFKMMENKLISNEFMPEIMRLQKDHSILMEMKYAARLKKAYRVEKEKLKSDLNSLILLVSRTLY